MPTRNPFRKRKKSYRNMACKIPSTSHPNTHEIIPANPPKLLIAAFAGKELVPHKQLHVQVFPWPLVP